MIELTPLRYFLSAYETGSFSQAARLNAVSQPTVSAAIQKLENELGAPIFIRSRSGLASTGLGDRLYRQSVASVEQLNGLKSTLAGESGYELRIFCQADILLNAFSHALNHLRRASNVKLRFTDQSEQSDLALVSSGCVPKGHKFQAIFTEGFGIAISRQNPLSNVPELTLQQLKREPFIRRRYCPNAEHLVVPGFHPAQFTADAIHDQQLLELVAADLGVAFVPMSHARAHNGLVVREIQGLQAGARTIGLSHRSTVLASDSAASVLATLNLRNQQ